PTRRSRMIHRTFPVGARASTGRSLRERYRRMKFSFHVRYQCPATRQRARNRSEGNPTDGGVMDCGARGLAVAAVMSELAVRAAEPATPLSEALIPLHLRCLRVGLPAVRGDEFDRSTVLLLYVGPRSCRADVLTPDSRS